MQKDRRKKQQNTSMKPIAEILCLALGVFFAMAYALNWNGSFAKIQIYLLGKCAFLLPLILLICFVQLFWTGKIHVFNKKTMAFVLVMLCLLGTAHHVFIPVNEEFNPSALPDGGGIIGGIVAAVLHNFFDEAGTSVILFFTWIAIVFSILPLRSLNSKIKKLLLQAKDIFSFSDKSWQNNKISTKDSTEEFLKQENLVKEYPADLDSAARIRRIYTSDEFNAFTDGAGKKSNFKSIFTFKKTTDNSSKEVKQKLDCEPVQVPDWAQYKKNTVVLRPIVDYETNIRKQTYFDKKTYFPEADNLGKSFSANRLQDEIFAKTSVNTDEMLPEKNIIEEANIEPSVVNIADSANNVYTPVSKKDETDLSNGEDNYYLPSIELLDMPKTSDPASYQKDIMEQCAVLEQTLGDFRVKAKVTAVTRGPSVTRFELEPAPGVKVSSVVNLADDIALRLAAPGVRIEAPIPGKSAIGIEAPNTKNDTVCFREVVDNDAVHQEKSKLCIGLGKDISGNIITADLAKMPHLLVAGSTGSGKSVCINTIIAGILYKARPEEVKLILVDPKVVELSNYNGIPHLLTPVVTEPKKAASALHWAVSEMERRYKLFADSHVREINSYNAQAQEKIPFIVIIIDELSDLMMVAKVDVEDAILRLAQKARAAGIHLILATQRPSVDVITGIVKANIPSRIAFAVSSQTDSRTIIDMGGAEKLLGKGDMLFYPIGFNKPVRVQGAFVSDDELNKVVDFIVKQSIPVNYSEEVTQQQLACDGNKNKEGDDSAEGNFAEDELFEDALNLVLDMGQASSSMLQRRFRIGYTRAARLVDTMEELGIIGQSVGSKPREVIMSRQEAESRFLEHE